MAKKDENKNAEIGSSSDMKPQVINSNVSILNQIAATGREIVKHRQRPLLVMYYDDNAGEVAPPDTGTIYGVILKGMNKKDIEEIDVLLHTRGGYPNTAYLIVQTLRKFFREINFLVPAHAYSAGTLMTLGGDKILMGPFASLGPIDLQLSRGKETLPIIDIDKYVEFVKHTVEKFAEEDNGVKKEQIAEVLLKQLTEEIKPTSIGHLFRLRTLSEYYARVLLMDYMFKNTEDRTRSVERIVSRLNHQYPDHGFDIDVNIASALGIKATLMDMDLFHLTDKFLKLCVQAKERGEICPFLPSYKCECENDFRIPYFEFFVLDEKEMRGGEDV